MLYITVTSERGEVVSENEVLLAIPAHLNLSPANVTFTVAPGKNGGAEVTLSSTKVALLVTLTTQSAGRFSENSFVLLPGKRTVQFFPFGPFDLSTFSSSLRVEHAQQYL